MHLSRSFIKLLSLFTILELPLMILLKVALSQANNYN